MASWMMHFRVAQSLWDCGALGEHPAPSILAAFVMGNIAPDSGVPTPDGKGYIPDKNTSHCMRVFDGVPAGQNRERCDPQGFADRWLTSATDAQATAFYLGYLCHLVTDNAWVRDFIYPAKERFAHLRLVDGKECPEGIARFYTFLKKDWYDGDFLYVKSHPDLPAYRVFCEMPPFENRYLPYFPADALEARRAEIEAFYRRGAANVTERDTYLTDGDLEAFIQRVTREIISEFGEFFDCLAQADEPAQV